MSVRAFVRSTVARRAIGAAILLGVAACGGGGGGSTAPPGGNNTGGGARGNEVTVANNHYTPANLTVTSGTRVTWTWDSCTGDGYGGQTCGSHTVTFDDGEHSPTQSQGSYSRSFAAAGTYPYHCTVHDGMTGLVTVQ